MPAPVPEIIVTDTKSPVRFSLEPAYNAIHSLILLTHTKKVTELGDWAADTLLSRHQLVMIGLYFSIQPMQSWPSFPAYVDHLEAMSPIALRDKLMDNYDNMPCKLKHEGASLVDKETALKSKDDFLAFLYQRFDAEHVDPELESHAYAYVVDPPSMKELVVSHLRHMWDDYLLVEWQRVKPMLRDAVRAFEQVEFSEMSMLEAAEFVADRPLSGGHWEKMLDKAEQMVFVPSAHVGPYLGKFMVDDTFGIIFGARLPEGTEVQAPALSRAEIVVRLGALADDTRLSILKLVAEEGEKRSQDIIKQLNLSQSATSRHLTQLSATGYLIERRCEGGKCYQLNFERVENTLHAVWTYLAD
jgi:DNA-binding transcriptional ArsR family regulator